MVLLLSSIPSTLSRAITLDSPTAKESRPGYIYYIIPEIGERRIDLLGTMAAFAKGHGLAHIRHQWFRKPKPLGGVKVILQHCLLLQELGFNAIPIRMGKHDGNFFGYPIETKHISEVSTALSDADIVVCPEVCPSASTLFQGGKKILFAQSWSYLYQNNVTNKEKTWQPYTEKGFDLVMCCSGYIAHKLQGEAKDKVAIVNNFIDLKSFTRDDSKRITGRVLALPRKNEQDLRRIMAILEKENIDFRLVDGLSQKELIKEYQAADIFLATGYPEGFGLPPLEAMACGAAVVGFTGGGANAFMIDGETALVAADGDCAGAAEKLYRLLSDNNLKTELKAAGSTIAAEFSEARTKSDLSSVFEKLALSHPLDFSGKHDPTKSTPHHINRES